MDINFLDSMARGESSSFPVLRNAGVTGFQSSAEYSSQAHGCPATGAQVAFHGDCSAWPGLVWPGFLNGWELACRHTLHHILASLPRAHHSRLPAPPSASGRPMLGAVGRQLSAWRLAVESNKDVGVFGSPAAEDETASDFGEHSKIFRNILSVQVYVVFEKLSLDFVKCRCFVQLEPEGEDSASRQALFGLARVLQPLS